MQEFQLTIGFGVVSLLNGITTLVGYLMPYQRIAVLLLMQSWWFKKIHTFLDCIGPNKNLIVELEFEHIYLRAAVLALLLYNCGRIFFI